jgi:hypothetical protein
VKNLSEFAGWELANQLGHRYIVPTRPKTAVPPYLLPNFEADGFLWQPKFDGSHKVLWVGKSESPAYRPFTVYTRHGDWRASNDGTTMYVSGPGSEKLASMCALLAAVLPPGSALSFEWLDKAKACVVNGKESVPTGIIIHDVMRWPDVNPHTASYMTRMNALWAVANRRGKVRCLPGTVRIDGIPNVRMLDLEDRAWTMHRTATLGPLYEGVVIRDLLHSLNRREDGIFKCRHANNTVPY